MQRLKASAGGSHSTRVVPPKAPKGWRGLWVENGEGSSNAVGARGHGSVREASGIEAEGSALSEIIQILRRLELGVSAKVGL